MSHHTTLKINLNAATLLKHLEEDSHFVQSKGSFAWEYSSDPHKVICFGKRRPYGILSVQIRKGEVLLSGDSDGLFGLRKKLSLIQVTSNIKSNPNYQSLVETEDGLEVTDWSGKKTRINFVVHDGVEIEPIMAGEGCLAATASLEQSLGTVIDRKFKDPEGSAAVHLNI